MNANMNDPEVTQVLADAWQQDAEDWHDVADTLAMSFQAEVNELVRMLRAMTKLARRHVDQCIYTDTVEEGMDIDAVCDVEDHLERKYLREYA